MIERPPSPAPRVIAVAVETPPHVAGPAETKRYLEQVFGASYPRIDRLLEMVDHTSIETRHFALPPDELVAARRLETSNGIYVECARKLGRSVAARALERSGLDPAEIGLVLAVSCTGYMIPSLDVHLVNDLGLDRGVRRLPVTELGCGGGTAGLALAADYVRAHPGKAALVVSVELCSLTFQPQDLSRENVIAAMLFGDGAAAAIVTDRPGPPGPAILADRTHLFPDTLDYMGFTLKDSGFHLIMSPQVPEMVRRCYRPLFEEFLADHGLAPADLGFGVWHPGGAKILRYLREYVDVPECWIAPAREVLRRYGNQSSASVLFVLEDVLKRRPPPDGAFGVLGSLGPGFCAELLLLRWQA